MSDFSEEIALVKKNSPPGNLFLEIIVKKEWRSTVSEYRSLIRQGFLERHSLEIENRLDFLDLDIVPVLKRNYISISHSSTEGGYAFSNLPFGFDLIERPRLNEKILARVSTSKEILEAADPCFLWPAKEAVFKACSDHLFTITEVHVEQWEKAGGKLLFFWRHI